MVPSERTHQNPHSGDKSPLPATLVTVNTPAHPPQPRSNSKDDETTIMDETKSANSAKNKVAKNGENSRQMDNV